MLVECLIEREGSTEVSLDRFKYRFEDDGTGAKVADVNSEDHRNYLIKTGFYRIYDPKMRERVEKEQMIKEKAQKKQAEDPVPDTVSPAVSIGLITREFMTLTKEHFAKWMTANKERVTAFPSAAKDTAISKWNRLFPGEECPVV